MGYDYKEGKERIEDILNSKMTIVESDKLPEVGNFTYNNAYYSFVSSIFVDIRDSTSLFTGKDKEKIMKIVRSFTSEVIDILNDSNLVREIGIRGDCVYAIYTTPTKESILEIFTLAITVNTFMGMLDKLLKKKEYEQIKVGIGFSTAQEHVIKAGRKNKTDLNSKVWIGNAVTKASNLSSLGNKNQIKSIVVSELGYINFIEGLKERNAEKDVEEWFTKVESKEHGIYYYTGIISVGFDNWINENL